MRSIPLLIAWLAISTSAWIPTRAWAGALDLYGFGPRAAAMGTAAVADPQAPSAVFYNPAGLVGPETATLSLGGLWSAPSLTLDRERPAASPDLSTSAPESFAGLVVGVQVPVGRIAEGRAALGLGLFLPSQNLLRAEAVDSSKPQFLRYQSQPDTFSALAAVAWQTPGGVVSLGAGLQALLDITGDIAFDVDLVGGRLERREVSVEVIPAVSPTAGVLIRPESTPGLRLGAAWRSALALEYDLPLRLDLGPAVSFDLRLQGTALYTPHQFTAGVAWDTPGETLTLAAEITWALWSGAPDPAPSISVDLSGTLIDGLGLGEALDVQSLPGEAGTRLVDTAIPRLGAEWRPMQAWAFRAGVVWRPTPAPAPDGPANYADSDALIGSFGVGWRGSDRTTVEGVVQWTQHRDRPVQKIDPQDPVGDYTIGGRVLTFQTGLRHAW